MTKYASKSKQRSLSIPDPVWDDIAATAEAAFGGNKSKALLKAWENFHPKGRPTRQDPRPILDLYTTYRPALAEEVSAQLKALKIKERQLLDHILSALAVYLEHASPDDIHSPIQMMPDNRYVENLAHASKFAQVMEQFLENKGYTTKKKNHE